MILRPKTFTVEPGCNVSLRWLDVSVFAICLVLLLRTTGFAADKQTAKRGAAKVQSKRASVPPKPDEGSDVSVEGKKAKVLSFGAMDVEGKMRTPQLLFFLGRVKAELDSSSQLRRSFIKELKATSKEKGL